jgi:hypothetical protein
MNGILLVGGAGLIIFGLSSFREAWRDMEGYSYVAAAPMETQRDFYRHMTKAYQRGAAGMLGLTWARLLD